MSAGGKIITFYSYKGGTGRSMALANVAWMLAAAGKRVLAIDWDMEAPGLHRYFHPFMHDPEATSTPGVIDFVTEFATAATHPHETSDPDWYLPYADLARYAVSLDTSSLIPSQATLDFIPSGRQGPAYAARVNSFDWQSFWDRLGGAALIEAMREQLRTEYDYVLIDSRTGVSDTSGICTIALPDTLVVGFTFNRQSINGAAAVTRSIVAKRDRSRFRVFPVPMRVEFAEKDRLELARTESQRAFDPFLWHIDASERKRYWGAVEVVYQPYYAYEEVLAVFADRPDQRTSLLAAIEQITALLTDRTVTAAIPPPESERREILDRYKRQPDSAAPAAIADALRPERYVFISAPAEARDFVRRLTDELETGSPPVRVWTAERDLLPGDLFSERLDEALRNADCVLMTVGHEESRSQRVERERALQHGKAVVPLVLASDALSPTLDLAEAQAIDFTGDFGPAVQTLRDYLLYLRSSEGERAALIRRLDEARQAGDALTDSDRLRQQVRIEDLEARLQRLEAQGEDSPGDELVVGLKPADRIEASWRGATVTSSVTIDHLGRRLLQFLSEWIGEGRLTKRRELEVLGELLYATLLPGAVASLLSQALDTASPERPLRLVINCEHGAEELAAMPWEYLYRPADEASTGAFLATLSSLVVSRAISVAKTLPAPRCVEGPPVVLMATYGAETRTAGSVAALNHLAMTHRVELAHVHNGSLRVILDRLDETGPSILHLVTAARRGPYETELATTDENGTVWTPGSLLVDLLSGVRTLPSVIVLELEADDRARPRVGVAPDLARLGVAAVLEVQSPLGNAEASTFFDTFYTGLAEGQAIDVAATHGRRHLTRRSESIVFGLPALYMNHPGPIAAPAGELRGPVALPGDEGAVTTAVDPAVRRRLRRALERAQPWRTLERLAIEAAVPEEVAMKVLRADDDVRFSKSRTGHSIAGLVSRVGP